MKAQPTLREALADLIDLAENFTGTAGPNLYPNGRNRIAAARAAFAQCEAQPDIERLKFDLRQAHIDYGVAFKKGDDEGIRETSTRAVALIDHLGALAASPPQEAQPVPGPLTELQIRDMAKDADLDWQRGYPLEGLNRYLVLARAIERIITKRLKGQKCDAGPYGPCPTPDDCECPPVPPRGQK